MNGVSAIVPTFNRRDTIGRAIRSIHEQTYDNIEIIVVDDSSTDNTKEFVENNFPTVRYICHEENRGASAARNTGIGVANHQYIAFLDSDDEWKPTKIERQLDLLKELANDFGVVYTGIKAVQEGRYEIWKSPSASGDIYKKQLSRDHVGPTSSVLAKKECFSEVGRFREDLNARQDYEMWLRISRRFKFAYIDTPLTILHKDSAQRISENTTKRIESHLKLIDEIKEELAGQQNVNTNWVLSVQYFTLARYCQRNNQTTEARAYFRKCLRLNPLFVKAWLALLLLITPFSVSEAKSVQFRNLFRKYG